MFLTYTFLIKNDKLVLMTFIHFIVMGVFEDQAEHAVVVDWGHAAILDLPPISSYPEPLVSWQADDNTQLYDRKYAVTSKHQLVILAASESDQKAYRFVLFNV